jgi:thiol:disulfide interchange protein DsbG
MTKCKEYFFEETMNRRKMLQTLTSVGLLIQPLLMNSSDAQVRTGQEPSPCIDLERLLDQIFIDGKGFEMGGSSGAAQTVYIIFDPQCPDCIGFWNLANKFKNQFRFIWIPVAILNSRSEPQGAMLLSSSNPIGLMNQQVLSFNTASRGISTESILISNDAREDVWRNSRMFRRAGGRNVPFAIYQDAQNKIIGSTDIETPESLTRFLKISMR